MANGKWSTDQSGMYDPEARDRSVAPLTTDEYLNKQLTDIAIKQSKNEPISREELKVVGQYRPKFDKIATSIMAGEVEGRKDARLGAERRQEISRLQSKKGITREEHDRLQSLIRTEQATAPAAPGGTLDVQAAARPPQSMLNPAMMGPVTLTNRQYTSSGMTGKSVRKIGAASAAAQKAEKQASELEGEIQHEMTGEIARIRREHKEKSDAKTSVFDVEVAALDAQRRGRLKKAMDTMDKVSQMKIKRPEITTGMQVAAGLVAAIEGFSKGMAGQTMGLPLANKIIDRHIQKEVERQEKEIARMKDSAAANMNLVGALRGEIGDKREARKMAVAQLKREMAHDLDMLSDQFKDKNKTLKGKQLASKQAKDSLGIAERTASRYSSTTVKRQVVPKTAGSLKAPKDVTKQHGKFMRAMANIKKIKADARRLSKDHKAFGAWSKVPTSKAQKFGQTSLDLLSVALRSGDEAGVMTDRDFARWKNAVSGNVFSTYDDILKRLDILEKNMRNGHSAYLKGSTASTVGQMLRQTATVGTGPRSLRGAEKAK